MSRRRKIETNAPERVVPSRVAEKKPSKLFTKPPVPIVSPAHLSDQSPEQLSDQSPDHLPVGSHGQSRRSAKGSANGSAKGSAKVPIANSSDVSDIAEDDSISNAFDYDTKKTQPNDADPEEAKQEYIRTVVLDRVIKYVKLDDVIKKKQTDHRKEMKIIKESKEKMEQFLINYLDKTNEEYIQIGNKAQLIKTQTTTTSKPKIQDIETCLIDGLKQQKIYEDDGQILQLVKNLLGQIDAKSKKKTRTYLKRKDTKKA
jgi:hypothetical protein